MTPNLFITEFEEDVQFYIKANETINEAFLRLCFLSRSSSYLLKNLNTIPTDLIHFQDDNNRHIISEILKLISEINNPKDDVSYKLDIYYVTSFSRYVEKLFSTFTSVNMLKSNFKCISDFLGSSHFSRSYDGDRIPIMEFTTRTITLCLIRKFIDHFGLSEFVLLAKRYHPNISTVQLYKCFKLGMSEGSVYNMTLPNYHEHIDIINSFNIYDGFPELITEIIDRLLGENNSTSDVCNLLCKCYFEQSLKISLKSLLPDLTQLRPLSEGSTFYINSFTNEIVEIQPVSINNIYNEKILSILSTENIYFSYISINDLTRKLNHFVSSSKTPDSTDDIISKINKELLNQNKLKEYFKYLINLDQLSDSEYTKIEGFLDSLAVMILIGFDPVDSSTVSTNKNSKISLLFPRVVKSRIDPYNYNFSLEEYRSSISQVLVDDYIKNNDPTVFDKFKKFHYSEESLRFFDRFIKADLEKIEDRPKLRDLNIKSIDLNQSIVKVLDYDEEFIELISMVISKYPNSIMSLFNILVTEISSTETNDINVASQLGFFETTIDATSLFCKVPLILERIKEIYNSTWTNQLMTFVELLNKNASITNHTLDSLLISNGIIVNSLFESDNKEFNMNDASKLKLADFLNS